MPVIQKGFTIVELLIVIVVIAVLATIGITAYNGMQQRAQNTKTISAVRQWSKALRLYKADHGDYPTTWSCLGTGYGKGFSGSDPTGSECRQDDASGSGSLNVNSGFMSAMSTYTNGTVTPAFVTAGSASYPWYRGAMFAAGYAGSKDRIDFILAGSTATCPSISGLDYSARVSYASTNSVRCSLVFPDSKY